MKSDEFDLDRWLQSADADLVAALADDPNLDLDSILAQVEQRAAGMDTNSAGIRLARNAAELSSRPTTTDDRDAGALAQVIVIKSPAASAGWGALSHTQRAIASLVSQAFTNQQIAHRLHLSPHTVNYHLRQIFRKLSINSRVELARIVREGPARHSEPGGPP